MSHLKFTKMDSGSKMASLLPSSLFPFPHPYRVLVLLAQSSPCVIHVSPRGLPGLDTAALTTGNATDSAHPRSQSTWQRGEGVLESNVHGERLVHRLPQGVPSLMEASRLILRRH